jgi:hypothetical protein
MVHLYLLYVAGLVIAHVWGYLRDPPAEQDDSPPEPTPNATGKGPFQGEPGKEGGRDRRRRPERGGSDPAPDQTAGGLHVIEHPGECLEAEA